MRSATGIGVFLFVSLMVPLFLAACGGDDPYDALDKGGLRPGQKAAPTQIQVPILSDQQGKSMVTFKCTACHPNTCIKRARLGKAEWEIRILKCKDKPGGAKISPMDAKSLSNYLANKYKD